MFPTQPQFHAHVLGCYALNSVTLLGLKKLEWWPWWATRPRIKSDDIFSHSDIIHKYD